MKRIVHAALKLVDSVCIVMFISMVICALLQVLFRYVLRISVPMTEELARLLYTLLIFTALLLVEAEDGQLKTTYLLEKLPFKIRWVVYGAINAACAVFICCMAYGAILMQKSSAQMSYGTMPWLSPSILYIPVYACAPFVVAALVAHTIWFKDTEVGRSKTFVVEEEESK